MAWMPTLSADTQAVLATDKVRFQGQEVAFVIADDRYSARDALELIDVEYEPLPVGGRRRARALEPDAPVIRDDHAGRDRQPHLRLGGRRRGGDRRPRSRAPTSSSSRTCVFPRSHPAPMETCGAVADFDRVERQADASGARRRRRTRTARCTRSITGLPEHKIRVISPDVGGGFGNKVPVYPGYVCAIAGAMLLGRPVKWMEDRSENLMSTGFARDYAMHGPDRRDARRARSSAVARRRDRRPRRVQRDRAADPLPGRVLQRLHRLLRRRGRALPRHRRRTRTRRRAASRTRARSGSPRRSTWSSASSTAWRASWASTRSSCGCATCCAPDQFPYASKTGWVYDSGDYERGAAHGAGARRLRRAAARAGARSARAAS